MLHAPCGLSTGGFPDSRTGQSSRNPRRLYPALDEKGEDIIRGEVEGAQGDFVVFLNLTHDSGYSLSLKRRGSNQQIGYTRSEVHLLAGG